MTPAKRYFFYSPEMNLLSESELTTLPAPVIQNDYVWFTGHPVGQVNGGTQWTFTDHLGTPLIQTNATGDVFWRAEYEPYGRVFSLRTAPQHQPLRLPGQESEELNLSTDGNGASERFYNIFRWYRYGWGRYTQSDPLSFFLDVPISDPWDLNLYVHAEANPQTFIDPDGLSGRRPGGPYVPPAGVKTKCRPGDTCDAIKGKLWLLQRMISSHQGWDWNVPPREAVTDMSRRLTTSGSSTPIASRCGKSSARRKVARVVRRSRSVWGLALAPTSCTAASG